MPKRQKKVYIVKAKGREYHYAWRNGPRIVGEPGTAQYHASLAEALNDKGRLSDDGSFRALVALYRSEAFHKLAPSTRRQWGPHLDRISDHFGKLSVAQFDRRERIIPEIRKWRDKLADKPRTADYAMQVLSRVLKHALDKGKISANPCRSIENLYEADRSDIIWHEADIKHLGLTCSKEVAFAVDMAAASGLRLGDLLRLSWSHIGDKVIDIPAGKGARYKRRAIVPLYGRLRAILATIPKHSTVVLTSSRRQPWTVGGFQSSFNDAKWEAWPDGRDLHFHDLRGTAATHFHGAGLSNREIAEILAWDESRVDKIIRRYVGVNARFDAIVRKIDEAERRT